MELDSKPLLSRVELQIHTVFLQRFIPTYITTLSRLVHFNWRISTVTIILLFLFMNFSNPPQWKFNSKLQEWPFNPDITARIRRGRTRDWKTLKLSDWFQKCNSPRDYITDIWISAGSLYRIFMLFGSTQHNMVSQQLLLTPRGIKEAALEPSSEQAAEVLACWLAWPE